MTPGVPGAPEPRMYPRSGYFLVLSKTKMILGIGLTRKYPLRNTFKVQERPGPKGS